MQGEQQQEYPFGDSVSAHSILWLPTDTPGFNYTTAMRVYYSPRNSGCRFSLNALGPSLASLLIITCAA
jgi:hypothetical protein